MSTLDELTDHNDRLALSSSDLRQRVIEQVRDMTVAEFREWAKKSGIWTKSGELTPEYGGQVKQQDTK